MMRFIYSLINVGILVAGLILVGRKIVARIFNGRREEIDRALDEAARPVELEPLPELKPTDGITAQRVSAVESAAAARLEAMERKQARQLSDLRRESLMDTRAALIDMLMEQAKEKVSAPAYRSRISARLGEAAEKILSAIRLTPGDMSYLANSPSLYVTLSSAEPLPDGISRQIQEGVDGLLRDVNGVSSFRTEVDESLLGGLRLRVGDTVYDYTVLNALYLLRKRLNALALRESSTEEMVKTLADAVENTSEDIDVFQVGRVLSVADGICWLDGVADIQYGELVEFENGEHGMVLDIQHSKVGCIIFGRYEHIEAFSRVRRLNMMASVPVGEELLGRVVNALGEPIDGKGRVLTVQRRNIECNAPPIPDRQSVSVPLHTGIKAIDALVPIGRGQRELIIGDRQTGKTALAIDAILAQKGQNVRCIYVAIGQKNATVAEIAERLEEEGAMEYTTIVSATASDSASLQYIAPFAGAAMAEYFMYKGEDALVIYDDLSKQAVAYRELSLLLQRPSGREAYPGDIFYLHSRLLERAARLNAEAGGGSVTALPIVETQAGDISAYIPTNVISITDGQIFLETDLFNEGQRPAVNAGLSVSRVGGAAQTKLIKQLSGSLRTGLAQYRELAAFTQLGSELDEATQKSLAAGDRMMAALRQGRYAPLAVWQEALILYAVSKGYADAVAPESIPEFENEMYNWFANSQPELVAALQSGAKLSDETESALAAALTAFNGERG